MNRSPYWSPGLRGANGKTDHHYEMEEVRSILEWMEVMPIKPTMWIVCA